MHSKLQMQLVHTSASTPHPDAERENQVDEHVDGFLCAGKHRHPSTDVLQRILILKCQKRLLSFLGHTKYTPFLAPARGDVMMKSTVFYPFIRVSLIPQGPHSLPPALRLLLVHLSTTLLPISLLVPLP